MAVYRISREKAQVETRLAIKPMVYLVVLASILGALVGGHSILFGGKADRLWFGTVGLGLVIMLIYSVRTTRRHLADVYSSFELSFESECVTRKQKNTSTISLPCSQISRIEEFQGKGLRICAQDRARNIWVPRELDGYEQLKAELSLLPIEFRRLQGFWLRTYGRIGLLMGLFAVQLLATNRFVASVAALVIAAWFFRAARGYYRSADLTTHGKQQLTVTLLIGVAMLVRSVWLLRG